MGEGVELSEIEFSGMRVSGNTVVEDQFNRIKKGDFFVITVSPDTTDRSWTYDIFKCLGKGPEHIRARKYCADGTPMEGSFGYTLIPRDAKRRKFLFAGELADFEETENG